MNVNCYLVVQGKRPRYATGEPGRREPGQIRITKTRPNTAADEIAVKLDIEIPDSLFIKPTLEARVTVPEGAGYGPAITTEVADNLADVIRQQTGLTVRLSVDDTEEGER